MGRSPSQGVGKKRKGKRGRERKRKMGKRKVVKPPAQLRAKGKERERERPQLLLPHLLPLKVPKTPPQELMTSHLQGGQDQHHQAHHQGQDQAPQQSRAQPHHPLLQDRRRERNTVGTKAISRSPTSSWRTSAGRKMRTQKPGSYG